MPDELPDITAPTIEPLTVAEVERAVQGGAAPADPSTSPAGESGTSAPGAPAAPPAPRRGQNSKKLSGAARRGDLTAAEYKKTKPQLAKELAEWRAKALAGGGTGPRPASAPATSVVVADQAREKMRGQFAGITTIAIVILFEALGKKYPLRSLSERNAERLGELWADYFVLVAPDSLDPKTLALLAAGGATAGAFYNHRITEPTAGAPAPRSELPATAASSPIVGPPAAERSAESPRKATASDAVAWGPSAS